MSKGKKFFPILLNHMCVSLLPLLQLGGRDLTMHYIIIINTKKWLLLYSCSCLRLFSSSKRRRRTIYNTLQQLGEPCGVVMSYPPASVFFLLVVVRLTQKYACVVLHDYHIVINNEYAYAYA
jgi:hypothetical protein